MKIFFRRIHLYLSFAAGLVVLIACFTGAILVFEKDLQMAMKKHRYFVAAGGHLLTPDQIVKAVTDSFPLANANGIKLYKDPVRSAEVTGTFSGQQEESKQTKASPQRQPGYTVFVNPYTGQVLEKYSYRQTTFYTVFALHRWLLGGEGSVGKYIVGISTLIFLFILLTGIVLWWPKTKKVLQQRVQIKWSAGWRRLTHDMHLVFGFYSAVFLFIIAFTGLAWSFQWFNKGIYAVTNSPIKSPAPPKSAYLAGAKHIPIAKALQSAQTVYGNAASYTVALPKDSTDAITVMALSKNAVHEGATDAVYIDQYTGSVLGVFAYANKSLGARVRAIFKPIHTGSIGGWPTKIIAFVVCVFGVTFPVTGTLMWLNRTRKKGGVKKRGKEVVTA